MALVLENVEGWFLVRVCIAKHRHNGVTEFSRECEFHPVLRHVLQISHCSDRGIGAIERPELSPPLHHERAAIIGSNTARTRVEEWLQHGLRGIDGDIEDQNIQ